MNKHIYVNDIQRIIKSLQPPMRHAEFHEWHLNPYLKRLDAIVLKNRGQHLTKASLDQIHVLYEQHWEEIAGSAACYTGDKIQSLINQVFIAIAKCIVEKFPERYSHYYKLLMPSARNLDKEFLTTYEPVLGTPLNSLLVANDFNLLSVADIVEYASRKKHLANVEMQNAPLALGEKEQLLRHKEGRAITTEVMFPRKQDLPPNVVNISTATAEAVRALAIGCLRGPTMGQLAIAEFYHHLNTLSQEEKACLDSQQNFKRRFKDLIDGEECIYQCGKQLCYIAFTFIRDEARWTDSHIQQFFSRSDRAELRTYPPQICIDTIDHLLVDDNPDNILDAENAINQLQLIKQYIEQTKWDLRNIKHTTLEVPERIQLPLIVKTAYMIIHKGMIRKDLPPVKILLDVKDLFCRSYFSEANSKNVQVLAFYRSFYTNKHMSHMIEQLSQPAQVDEQSNVEVMLPKK